MNKYDWFVIISSIVLLSITFFLGFVVLKDNETNLDRRLKEHFTKMGHNSLIAMMAKITKFGNVETLMIISIPIVFFTVSQHNYVSASAIIMSVMLSVIAVHTLKFIFRRKRPKVTTGINYMGYSFPSGHSCVSMSFYLTIAYVLSYGYKFFFVTMLISIVFAFMIAISRIILGVHWFTDVAIGSFIGLICAYWSIYMFRMNYYFTFIFG